MSTNKNGYQSSLCCQVILCIEFTRIMNTDIERVVSHSILLLIFKYAANGIATCDAYTQTYLAANEIQRYFFASE